MEDSSGGNEANSGIKYPPPAAAVSSSSARPYRCELCQRSFREVATLRKHEQLHRADRPYVCQTCGKSFLWSSNLKVHERVHTGERPYKCKICHRCFTQSNDLRRHERNVHMRGKLYGYRNPARPTPQVNLAAYQAFAMQQRALLQQALTYETLMHNTTTTTSAAAVPSNLALHDQSQQQAAMLQGKPPPTPQQLERSSQQAHQRDMQSEQQQQQQQQQQHLQAISSLSSIKLEQVTPPTTPSEMEEQQHGVHKSMATSSGGSNCHSTETTTYVHTSTPPSLYTIAMPSRSVIHSPPSLTSVADMSSSELLRTSSAESQKDKEKQYPSTSSASQILSPSNTPLTDLPQTAQMAPPLSTLTRTSDDSVMDLSMNKSAATVSTASMVCETATSENYRWKRGSFIQASKTPSLDSESEEKRDVTTTSATPTTDVGFHQCFHCGIYFHDYTMFHLHQSLHSPIDEDPFRCPSCNKHCQDRIEFTFHIVWHVKYPHTIPNYQPFKESYLC
ncbi:vascular endothelial zinc finger 1-like [Argonauta hians]